MCLVTNSKQALLCPYRDEIKKIVETLPEMETTLNEIHERLFVKKNNDPLIVEIERNTEFREKVEAEGTFKKRNKWSRYGFWIAVLTLFSMTLFNSIILIANIK